MAQIRLIGARAIVASIAFLTAACADAPISAPAAPQLEARPIAQSFVRGGGRRAADHVVVEIKGAEAADFSAAVAALGGQIERRMPEMNVVVVKGLSSQAIASLTTRTDVAEVTNDVRVRWIPARTAMQKVTATHRRRPVGVDQSDAAFFEVFQWNMKVTKANEAWTTTPGGRHARVYVLDSGIDPTHADLDGIVDVESSRSFAESEPDIFDHNAHGTFVSAIIASNGIGVASVAPLAKIAAVKVLDVTGEGSFADVIAGIMYAARDGADVINMSFGAFADLTNKDDRRLVKHLQKAIAHARAKGVVVVAAAGNEGVNLSAIPPQFIAIPAELDGVIGVGATAPVNQVNFDQIASYSNFGWTGSGFGDGVQIFAPGGDLVGADLRDLIVSACSQFAGLDCGPLDYLLGAGTSFASAMVAGEAAVNRSILGSSRHDAFTNSSCILRGTDEIGPKSVFGRGRMNVVKAAKCASKHNRGSMDDRNDREKNDREKNDREKNDREKNDRENER